MSAARAGLAAALLLALAALASGSGDAADRWPRWLGPRQTGAADDPGAFQGRGRIGLRKLWSVPVEGGRASVVVASGRAYTLAREEGRDTAFALDAATGTVVWKTPLDQTFLAGWQAPGSTPTLDGARVFALSSACTLRALSVETGAVLWSVDLKQRFGDAPRQGCASSPVVEGGRLLLVPGARQTPLVALSPETGATLWSAELGVRATYTAPVVRELLGERLVMLHHFVSGEQGQSTGLTAFRAGDGNVVLSHTRASSNVSFETPVPVGDAGVLLVSWNDAHLVKLARREGRLVAEPGWTTADLIAYVSPPVVHGGHVYGLGREELVCLDAASGRTLWKEKTYAGSLALVDGHLLLLSVASGQLRVVEATPEGYREKARLEVFTPGSKAEGPPSYAGRRIFVRNDEEIAAVAIE